MLIDTTQPEKETLVDLATGEVISLDDPDALCESYRRLSENIGRLSELKKKIALAIDELADGKEKTQYVRGRRLRAKVVKADDSWEQSVLKEAWNSYPKLRDEFLAIAALRVKKRAWNKLLKSKCPKELEGFRAVVEKANRGPRGSSKITVEDLNADA